MELLGLIGNLHATELILILLIILVLFGGAKIPQLMRNLGRGVKEFKEGMAHSKEEPSQSVQPAQPPAQTPQVNPQQNPPPTQSEQQQQKT